MIDDFLARRFSERLVEIQAEIVGALKAAGRDVDGPPEWDDYGEQRKNPPSGPIPPTPAQQEAMRRLKAGSPEHVLAVSQWILQGEVRKEVGE